MEQKENQGPPKGGNGFNCCLQIVVGGYDTINGKSTTLYAGGRDPEEVKDLIKFGIEELQSLAGEGNHGCC